MNEAPNAHPAGEQPPDAHTDGPADEDAVDLRQVMRARRQGKSLRAWLAQPDRYGVLLVFIVASMFAVAVLDQGPVAHAVAVAAMGFTLMFALHTSRAPRRLRRSAYIAVPVIIIVTSAWARDATEGAEELVAGITLVLFVAVLASIFRRMAVHLTISASTVLAGLCIYVLLGLVYSSIYGLIVASGTQLFAQTTDPTSFDTLYFSFITMTTVGYGDLSPIGDLPRILAASEALIGQIYLVTAVALLVGNIGRQRRRLGS
jgi:hypothetical protein